MKNISDIIIKPIISEKSLSEASLGRYTFQVLKSAGKQQIRNDIEKIFNVKVERVFTNLVKGSRIISSRYGRKKVDNSYKKARVLLEKGQKIEIFEEKSK